jgi:hypothetical protein
MSKRKDLSFRQQAQELGLQISQHVPLAVKHGFEDGREAGHHFVEDVPHNIGYVCGLAFGTSESVVGALAVPINALANWAGWLIQGDPKSAVPNEGN